LVLGTNKIIEQVYIASGRVLDPDKYFMIVINQIGGGLSTSAHNALPPAGSLSSRAYRQRVRAQGQTHYRKIRLKRVALVIGVRWALSGL